MVVQFKDSELIMIPQTVVAAAKARLCYKKLDQILLSPTQLPRQIFEVSGNFWHPLTEAFRFSAIWRWGRPRPPKEERGGGKHPPLPNGLETTPTCYAGGWCFWLQGGNTKAR